jgi:glycogen(starch) synthase
LWRLRRLVADERPDVVVTIGPAAVRYGGLAACLSGCGRLVIGWPGVDFDYCGAVASCFGRCMARRCERIVLASEAEREAAIAHGWPADRIAVVPMAATPRERTMDRKTVFAALGIAAASPVIGVVAPWRPRHRVKEAIWEFDLIRAMRDDVRMIVAGDGPWRAELELFREQQECQNAIRFVSPGKLPAEWVAHCDAIWSLDPALRVAHATLAATASGVPIVAVDTPGHRSFIAHGETGLLVPISVRPAAPQATLELLADAALRERIGAAAKRSMAERHGAAAVAAGLARLLESPTR